MKQHLHFTIFVLVILAGFVTVSLSDYDINDVGYGIKYFVTDLINQPSITGATQYSGTCPGVITGYNNMSDDIIATGDCFTIGADDTTLDCAGRSIIGPGITNDAVLTDGFDNIKIFNCNINNFANGINMGINSENIQLVNITANSNTYALLAGGCFLGGCTVSGVQDIYWINSTPIDFFSFNGAGDSASIFIQYLANISTQFVNTTFVSANVNVTNIPETYFVQTSTGTDGKIINLTQKIVHGPPTSANESVEPLKFNASVFRDGTFYTNVSSLNPFTYSQAFILTFLDLINPSVFNVSNSTPRNKTSLNDAFTIFINASDDTGIDISNAIAHLNFENGSIYNVTLTSN